MQVATAQAYHRMYVSLAIGAAVMTAYLTTHLTRGVVALAKSAYKAATAPAPPPTVPARRPIVIGGFNRPQPLALDTVLVSRDVPALVDGDALGEIFTDEAGQHDLFGEQRRASIMARARELQTLPFSTVVHFSELWSFLAGDDYVPCSDADSRQVIALSYKDRYGPIGRVYSEGDFVTLPLAIEHTKPEGIERATITFRGYAPRGEESDDESAEEEEVVGEQEAKPQQPADIPALVDLVMDLVDNAMVRDEEGVDDPSVESGEDEDSEEEEWDSSDDEEDEDEGQVVVDATAVCKKWLRCKSDPIGRALPFLLLDLLENNERARSAFGCMGVWSMVLVIHLADGSRRQAVLDQCGLRVMRG